MYCESEAIAKERAQWLNDHHDVELWDGDTKIAAYRKTL